MKQKTSGFSSSWMSLALDPVREYSKNSTYEAILPKLNGRWRSNKKSLPADITSTH
jgi:hypothetical protein